MQKDWGSVKEPTIEHENVVENVEELEAFINVPNNIISKIIQIENLPSV